jgi:predicted Zn-dependent protease
MTELHAGVAAQLREAASLAHKQHYAEALAVARPLVAQDNTGFVVHSFIALVALKRNDHAQAAAHFAQAVAVQPEDIGLRTQWVAALIGLNDMQAALAACPEERARLDAQAQLWRLRGYILLTMEQWEAAARAYQQVVARHPQDFDSWNNLGNAFSQAGEAAQAVEALQRAVALRPDSAPSRYNLASAHQLGGDMAAALAVLEQGLRDFPQDAILRDHYAEMLLADERLEALLLLRVAQAAAHPSVAAGIKLGEAHILLHQLEEAETVFGKLRAQQPAHEAVLLHLALIYEFTNQVTKLEQLFADVEQAQASANVHGLLGAMVARRNKQFAHGLALLQAVEEDYEPERRYQLAGEFHERLGDAAQAFAAYARVNAAFQAHPSNPKERAALYREEVRGHKARMTQAWVQSWRRDAAAESASADPVFLLGFPRSGTTLLDTMLMGHSHVQVLEECPTVRTMAEALGDFERIAHLSADECAELRKTYFHTVQQHINYDPHKLLVDKFPLYLNRAPLIHRVFPKAKFILALRHPYDVVLSCFITSFHPNNAMCNFMDVRSAAELYDLSFSYWEQCRALLPLAVHEVKYENMVEDTQAELKPLFAFLGLDWEAESAEHERTAQQRKRVGTASYAQITEPIYSRAVARWERYQEQLGGVMPLLEPWTRHWGYM